MQSILYFIAVNVRISITQIEGAFSTSKDSAMVFKRSVAVIKSAKFFRGNPPLSLSQNLIYNIKISCHIYKTSQIAKHLGKM